MSDIIEQLRHDIRPHTYWDLRSMAADEIEQLRADNAKLRRDLEIWRRNGGDDLMRAEIERQAHEIEGLRDERLHWKRQNGLLEAGVERLRADNAKLREALQALLNDADNLEAACEWDEHRELARRALGAEV